MRAVAQESKATDQTKSAKSALPRQTRSMQEGPLRCTLHLQRIIGNQAAQRLLQEDAGQIDAEAASVDQTLASAGKPLEAELRQDMESRFGHDFSKVRVHSDANAAASANTLGASAYTVGQHIVFGRDHFDPRTAPGQRLIAHELAHAIQQRGGGTEPWDQAPMPGR